jgi:uncharacterized protein
MKPPGAALATLAQALRAGRGLAAKADIAMAVDALGLAGGSVVAVGDDCAAIVDGNAYLLFAIEGFLNEFVAADPWFAGWCGVMVNLSDIAAMGGRPVAITNAVWADGSDAAAALFAGMRAASEAYGVPIVGGHTNLRTERGQLAVSVLGRAQRLLTSFDARPGQRLVAAIDLRGGYRPPFANWEAATDAPPGRLRADLGILPAIAEAGLASACKDISQGGLVGTAAMLAECSGVALDIEIGAVPRPQGVGLETWLATFPSFGFLLAADPSSIPAILAAFTERGIAAADIGAIEAGSRLDIIDGASRETIWDFSDHRLIGCAPRSTVV